jgi:hypothetical protein
MVDLDRYGGRLVAHRFSARLGQVQAMEKTRNFKGN